MWDRGVVILACFVILAAAACAEPAQDGTGNEPNASSLDPDSCRRALEVLGRGAGPQPDAPTIAESLDVSVEDAELYLRAQGPIGAMQGRLLRDGPPSF